MRLLVFALVLVLTGCGGVVDSADVPPSGTIWFGQSFNPSTFAMAGRTTSVSRGAPVSMVGNLGRSMKISDLQIRTSFDGSVVGSQAAAGSGEGEIVGFTLGPLLAAGSWTYEIIDVGGNVLALGTITVTD